MTEERASLRALKGANVRPGESVLEVAVGTGKLFLRLAGLAAPGPCLGLDLSRGMVQRTRARLAREGGQPGVICRADARHLPFPDRTFDALVNCYMLDLLADNDMTVTLEEFGRVLKPSGRLVLLSMSKQAEWFNAIWMALYRWSPALVGGCRPVAAVDYLKSGGWIIQTSELISQCCFRSELLIACPPSGGRVR